jgi:hypothetical protein
MKCERFGGEKAPQLFARLKATASTRRQRSTLLATDSQNVRLCSAPKLIAATPCWDGADAAVAPSARLNRRCLAPSSPSRKALLSCARGHLGHGANLPPSRDRSAQAASAASSPRLCSDGQFCGGCGVSGMIPIA